MVIREIKEDHDDEIRHLIYSHTNDVTGTVYSFDV